MGKFHLKEKMLFAGLLALSSTCCHADLKSENEAEKELQKYNAAIELYPNDADSYFLRGSLHFEQGRGQKAIDDYTKALQLDPEDAESGRADDPLR